MPRVPTLVQCGENVKAKSHKLPVTKTLFLVRHGEALHNIEEQRARRLAEAEAEAQGYEPGSDACRAQAEAARKLVLEDERLMDAGLSEAGKAEAQKAKAEMESLLKGGAGLPWPNSVYVSPLQRTLQTAAILFPGHPGVHIREFLRERRTGLPCDERHPAAAMAKRASFQHMSFAQLSSLDEEDPDEFEKEDAPKLRCRTARLADILSSAEDDSLCVVTHKGFLRELERGPLGRPEATEFRNCEVRVYSIELLAGGGMVASLLYGKGKQSSGPEPSCAQAQRVARCGAGGHHSEAEPQLPGHVPPSC
mmetsp:Transcript_43788/g.88281  ORF Transcript_43788/g.88281 Transcript_43788/m.88281 type:complete len:308 (+) Transcript_43788:62-985(+)